MMGVYLNLPDEYQSPIITAFYSPNSEKYNFRRLYNRLKDKGFVIYPGKVTQIDSFRIGNIGHVFPGDIKRLLTAIEESMFWNE